MTPSQKLSEHGEARHHRGDFAHARPHVLRQYAMIADGERGIIVGPSGDFAWMCFPQWDGDAVFSSLLGGAGTYAISPRGRCVWAGYYDDGCLIWRSRWVTEDSIIEVHEALAMPGDLDRAVILRRVVACHGTARVEVALNPRASFGAQPFIDVACADDGTWTGRTGDIYACWRGGGDAFARESDKGGTELQMELELTEGESHEFVLVLASNQAKANERVDPADAWKHTDDVWRERVPRPKHVVGERDAHHAYAVMAGLTSSSGGMVAAATMSIPERAEQGRNYDYRYAWIRDQCYAGLAVAKIGPYQLMDDAVSFVGARLLEHGADLRPAYTTGGGRVPDQRTLDLPGYPGGSVVAGNWVNEQFQLDAFGEALQLFAAASRHDHLNADGWRAAETAAAAIEQRWQEPDAGIWEIDPQEWTHSRLACVAGLRAISACRSNHPQAARWTALADTILADTSKRFMHPSGRWQRAVGDPRLDVALLVPALRGALAADDPRTRTTLQAVNDELTEDGYVYRYKPDERPLGESEGAFLLCGFIMSLAWAHQGDGLASSRWYERTRAACGPPALLAEEFDVAQHQLRGNLPQAFVHALLLECSVVQYELGASNLTPHGRG